ncbi:hypothetical protein [Limosilactobacillus sp.]|uniref:hypothetical protein n=1 Tax=Limosilactobacillus sp. TaxID=2773925 RepID=UPI003F077EAB
MKKIGLICVTLVAGLSLAGCNNLASQQAHKTFSSSSPSTKVVKHHKKHASTKRSSSSSSSSSAQSSQAASSSQQAVSGQQSGNTQASQSQQTAAPNADHNPASNNNYNNSELQRNAQAAVGSDGLMHGRVYGSNGYWIDVDASRQGLANAGMPNSDQDIMNHAETGNAMWNAGQ